MSWDPAKAVQYSNNNAIISPATILLHELAHAAGYDSDLTAYDARRATFESDFDNAEDRRVIQMIENPFAEAKGEGVRVSHKGKSLAVSSITRHWE